MPDADSDDWIENSVQLDSAPGLVFDGDSGTQGLVPSAWINLGIFGTQTVAEGATITMNNVNLVAYLNQLTYREGDDTTVTLAVERYTSNVNQTRFASKEATHLASTAPGSVSPGTYAPRLVLDALLLPDEGLDGDFDGDNDVDGFDFLWWQINDGSPESLELWETNYGTVETPPPLSAASTVPEPGSITLLLCGAAAAMHRRRNSA